MDPALGEHPLCRGLYDARRLAHMDRQLEMALFCTELACLFGPWSLVVWEVTVKFNSGSSQNHRIGWCHGGSGRRSGGESLRGTSSATSKRPLVSMANAFRWSTAVGRPLRISELRRVLRFVISFDPKPSCCTFSSSASSSELPDLFKSLQCNDELRLLDLVLDERRLQLRASHGLSPVGSHRIACRLDIPASTSHVGIFLV